jgi:hypothetical protein
MKNTPGPWAVATSNSWRRIVSRDYGTVCEPVVQRDGHPDLHFKNGGVDGPDAKLIEAAPDLLDALENMVRLFDGYQGMQLTDAKAAIAKARGVK